MTFDLKLKKFSHVDPILFLSTLALLSLGTIMVFSASSLSAADRFGDSTYYLKRHLTAMALGWILMTACFFVNIRLLRKVALPALFGVGLLLTVTLFTSAGLSANHATRWLSLGGLTFQPSELAKFVLILYVAAYLTRKKDKIHDFFHGLLPLFLTVSALLALILKQPDFGTVVVAAMAVFAMLFVGRAKLSHLMGLALCAAIGGVILIATASYRLERIKSFLSPWKDPLGSGFQIIQSFVAFQHGGWHGQGLGDGTQKLLYLPEAHTDFIFAVIAEELGFVGTLAVILLFATLVVRGLKLSMRLLDPFSFQLAVGLTVIIGFQAFLNMAVVMGLVPTKGLTLPLVSYGGTSLMVSMASIGLLLSLSSTVTMTGKMARRTR